MLIATGALTLVEFLADKIPAFDSLWDGVQTFVRVPAGALLAWGVFAHASPEVQAIAALLGGALAVTHPLAFLVALALFVLLLAWMLPKLWRGVRAVWRRLRDPFGRYANALAATEPPSRR